MGYRLGIWALDTPIVDPIDARWIFVTERFIFIQQMSPRDCWEHY